MSEELKPCPFCGGEADLAKGKFGDGKTSHYVECMKCAGMADMYGDSDSAIAAWNTRTKATTLADSEKQVKKLEGVLKKALNGLEWAYSQGEPECEGRKLIRLVKQTLIKDK